MRSYHSPSPFSVRRILVLLLVALCLLPSVTAQTPASTRSLPPASTQAITPVAVESAYRPGLLAELERVRQAALASDYAYRQVAHLANNIGPRLSGSPQAQHAVEYVAAELRKLGLDVRLEKVLVPHWVRGIETGALVEYPGQAPGTTQMVVLTALGGSTATPAAGTTAEVVVVNDFAELQALGRARVQGKLVLFNHRFDQQMAAQGYGGEAYGQAVVYRGAGPSAAARLGAIACLVRSVGGLSYRLPHTGATRYAKDAPEIPAAAITAEDADMIAALAREGRVRMQLTLTPQRLPDAESYNVVADLKGSERPEQIVIVSGHLDSWDLGTGAIDDAAGVAVAMQTAQLFRQLKLKPRRTLRVIAWMNEENGTMGGRTYAREYAAEVGNHFAAVESDRGAGHPLGLEILAKPGALEMLRPVAEVLARQGAGLLRAVNDTEADISPLAAAGVPAFGLWQDTRTYFDYHHTPADTLDKINPRELAENAAAMAVLADALTNLTQPLPR